MILTLVLILFGCSSTTPTIAQSKQEIETIEESLNKTKINISKAQSVINTVQKRPNSEHNKSYIESMKRNIEASNLVKDNFENILMLTEKDLNRLEENGLTKQQEKEVKQLKHKILLIKKKHYASNNKSK